MRWIPAYCFFLSLVACALFPTPALAEETFTLAVQLNWGNRYDKPGTLTLRVSADKKVSATVSGTDVAETPIELSPLQVSVLRTMHQESQGGEYRPYIPVGSGAYASAGVDALVITVKHPPAKGTVTEDQSQIQLKTKRFRQDVGETSPPKTVTETVPLENVRPPRAFPPVANPLAQPTRAFMYKGEAIPVFEVPEARTEVPKKSGEGKERRTRVVVFSELDDRFTIYEVPVAALVSLPLDERGKQKVPSIKADDLAANVPHSPFYWRHKLPSTETDFQKALTAVATDPETAWSTSTVYGNRSQAAEETIRLMIGEEASLAFANHNPELLRRNQAFQDYLYKEVVAGPMEEAIQMIHLFPEMVTEETVLRGLRSGNEAVTVEALALVPAFVRAQGAPPGLMQAVKDLTRDSKVSGSAQLALAFVEEIRPGSGGTTDATEVRQLSDQLSRTSRAVWVHAIADMARSRGYSPASYAVMEPEFDNPRLVAPVNDYIRAIWRGEQSPPALLKYLTSQHALPPILRVKKEILDWSSGHGDNHTISRLIEYALQSDPDIAGAAARFLGTQAEQEKLTPEQVALLRDGLRERLNWTSKTELVKNLVPLVAALQRQHPRDLGLAEISAKLGLVPGVASQPLKGNLSTVQRMALALDWDYLDNVNVRTDRYLHAMVTERPGFLAPQRFATLEDEMNWFVAQLKSPHEEIRLAAARFLVTSSNERVRLLKHPEAIRRLNQVLRGDRSELVRAFAALALEDEGDEGILRVLLESDDPIVRRIAAKAARRRSLASPELLAAYRKLLHDPNRWVADEAHDLRESEEARLRTPVQEMVFEETVKALAGAEGPEAQRQAQRFTRLYQQSLPVSNPSRHVPLLLTSANPEARSVGIQLLNRLPTETLTPSERASLLQIASDPKMSRDLRGNAIDLLMRQPDSSLDILWNSLSRVADIKSVLPFVDRGHSERWAAFLESKGVKFQSGSCDYEPAAE